MIRLLVSMIFGLVGFVFPRFLIALGIPLEHWIEVAGGWFGFAVDNVDIDLVVSGLSIVLLVMLTGIEYWFRPVARVWETIFQNTENSKNTTSKYELEVGRISTTAGTRRFRTAASRRNVWILNAAYYLASGSWEEPRDIFHEPTLTNFFRAFDRIQQAALDGDLTIWGREGLSGPFIEIPKDYWRSYGFNPLRALAGGPEELETEQQAQGTKSNYGSLRSLKTDSQQLADLIKPELTSAFEHQNPAVPSDASMDEQPFPDMKLADLVRLCLQIDTFLNPDPDGRIGRFLHEIREAALHKRIQIWGRRDCGKEISEFDIVPREPIDFDYWRECKINEYAFITGDGWAETTSDGGDYCAFFGDLQVSQRQAKKVWRARIASALKNQDSNGDPGK